MNFVIERLTDVGELKDFRCGVKAMDTFIQDGLGMSVVNHYCNAYAVRVSDRDVLLAIFALSFDSLDLDADDKEDLMTGNSVEVPSVTLDYKEIFLNKTRYPAIEITYLAVDERYAKRGLGRIIIENIVKKAQEQELAGCQFLTVEALNVREHNATGFYSRCGFSPCEIPNPNKGVLRMYRTLYPQCCMSEDESL